MRASAGHRPEESNKICLCLSASHETQTSERATTDGPESCRRSPAVGKYLFLQLLVLMESSQSTRVHASTRQGKYLSVMRTSLSRSSDPATCRKLLDLREPSETRLRISASLANFWTFAGLRVIRPFSRERSELGTSTARGRRRNAWTRQRELPYSDSAARGIVDRLGRLLLFGWPGRPSPSWSPLPDWTFAGAVPGEGRHPVHQMVFLPSVTKGHTVDCGEYHCGGQGDRGLFSPVQVLSWSKGHLPYTPKDRLRKHPSCGTGDLTWSQQQHLSGRFRSLEDSGRAHRAAKYVREQRPAQ